MTTPGPASKTGESPPAILADVANAPVKLSGITPLTSPEPPPAASEKIDNEPIEQLGRIVGSGMALMVVATVVNKGMTMLAQWVLGLRLSAEDFAVYAYATAIAGFTMVCREAGIRELLVQRGHTQYENLAGTGFWLALTYNLIVAGIMALIAIPIAALLHQPELKYMLWVMALALPIGTVGGLLQTSMRLHLRFREFAANNLSSSVARQGSSMIFALSGVGALSLAWPVLVGAVTESVGAFARTRDALWKRPAQRERWPTLLRESKWLMFASVANFAVDWGPFLLMAVLAAAYKVTPEQTAHLARFLHMDAGALTGILKSVSLDDKESGYFYFAFMISAQIGVLLSFNLSLVLTPALARLNDNRDRLAHGVLRSLRTLMLAGSIGSLGLASIIAPLQHLLWKDKWDPAVPAVIILAVFFPWRITFGICSSLLQAQGRFRLYAFLTFIEGAGLTIFTIVGAIIEPTATSMAWWAGGWLFVSRLGATIWIFRTIDVRWTHVVASTAPAWVLAVIAAGVGFLGGRYLPVTLFLPTAPGWTVDLLSTVLGGSACTLVFVTLCRLLLRSHLEEMLSVAPHRLRPIMARVLLLPVAA